MHQHEVLLLLAGHGTASTSSPLLHPGEAATLDHLATIAELYKKVQTFCNSTQKTTSLSALSAILSTNVVRPYMAAVLSLEVQIMRGMQKGFSSVPLALVMAEMGVWEALLNAAKRLMNALERGVSGAHKRNGKGKEVEETQEWTAAPLLTLLQAHSNTGLVPWAAILRSAITAVSGIWLASFSSFLIWARLSKEPIFQIISADTNPATFSIPTYIFPNTSLPHLPSISNLATRAALEVSISKICTSLSVLHSIPTDGGTRDGSESGGSIELSRALRVRLEGILQGCTGPGDESFPSRISQIEGELE